VYEVKFSYEVSVKPRYTGDNTLVCAKSAKVPTGTKN